MASVGTHDTELFDLQRRLVILRAGLLLVVALLGLRLWHLQVREGPYYRDLSENNRTRSVILEPARGLIFDRHGVLLANNVPSFSLYVTLEDVKDREGSGRDFEPPCSIWIPSSSRKNCPSVRAANCCPERSKIV